MTVELPPSLPPPDEALPAPAGQLPREAEKVLLGWKYSQGRFGDYIPALIVTFEQNKAPALLCIVLRLELEGGNCPDCSKPWHKVEVRNKMAHFDYYDPSCSCFPRCSECGSSHHRAVAMGVAWAKQPQIMEGVTPCPCCKNAVTRVNQRYAKAGKQLRVVTEPSPQLLLPIR